MELIALLLAQYWRQLIAIVAVIAVVQWLIANALLVAGIVAAVVVVLFWLARTPKPAPTYPHAEINPDLQRRLEAYKAGKR